MPQLTDQQILDLLRLSAMPEVSVVSVSQQQDSCDINIHGTVDADMMLVVEAVERIVPGLEFQPSPIRDKENGKTVQWLSCREFDLTIYSTQTFDVQTIPA